MTPEIPPRNACLFLDVDGTLIDIAATPDAVRVPPGLVGDLARAERSFGGAVALVSGRSIAELDRLFAPLRLAASGVHGAEFRLDGAADAPSSRTEPIPRAVWDDLVAVLAAFPGTLVEDKGFSFAVHYRAAPATGPSLRAALAGFLRERTGLGLVILPGHSVFELKRADVDKGVAIADFMRRPPFTGRRPVFIGDDVTDAPGFATVRHHDGWAYSVRQVFPGVSGTFPDPAAVRRWLAGIDHTETLSA